MKKASISRSSVNDDASASESATVYSDVSFMGRDTVAFSLRLRESGSAGIRRMGTSMVASFLPDLHEKNVEDANGDDEEREGEIKVSKAQAAVLLEDYDECPEDHPDCNERNEKWDRVEDAMRKGLSELSAIEAVLFEAQTGRDQAKSKREIVTARLEDKDDQNLDKQTNVRKLKDDISEAQAAMEEHHGAVSKLENEITALTRLIAEQQSALANDGSRESTRTEIVRPQRGHRSAHEERDAEAVRFLPDDINKQKKSPLGPASVNII